MSLFLLGLVLVWKGTQEAPDPKDIVPREEFSSVQKELDAAKSEEVHLKQQLDALAVDLHQAQEKVQESQELEGMLNSLQQHEEENQETIYRLEKNFNFLRQKADQQARAAKEIIELIQSEKEALRHEMDDVRSKVDEEEFLSVKRENQQLHSDVNKFLDEVKDFERRLHDMQDEYETRISHSDGELLRHQQQTDRLKTGLLLIIQKVRDAQQQMLTTRQAYDLKYQQVLREKESLDTQAREKMLHLQEQSDVYQKQIHENNETILALERSLLASQEKIDQSHTLISQLQVQLKTEQDMVTAALPKDLEEDRRLRDEREKLLNEKADLERKLREMRELNEFLQKKEKILQRELTKSRTEALGFRRMCDSYKTKIENNH